jgi:hypothetical protein
LDEAEDIIIVIARVPPSLPPVDTVSELAAMGVAGQRRALGPPRNPGRAPAAANERLAVGSGTPVGRGSCNAYVRTGMGTRLGTRLYKWYCNGTSITFAA